MNVTTLYCILVFILTGCNGFNIFETNFGKVLKSAATSTNDVDGSVQQYKIDKNAINEAFKGLREIVDDPIYINEIKMNYNIPDAIRTEGFARNVTIAYLKNSTLNNVNVASDDSYNELKIIFPFLNISGKYNMSFYVDRHNFSAYGNDSFSLEVNNFQIFLNVSLEKNKDEGYIVVKKIDWNQTLGGVKVNIRNLFDDGKAGAIISEILTIAIPTLHDAYVPAINEVMSQIATSYWYFLFSNFKTFNPKSFDLKKMIKILTEQASKLERCKNNC